MFVRDERGYNQVFPRRGTSTLRAERRAKWLARQLEAAGVRHAVEIGCGLGETAFQVAESGKLDVLAVDISLRFIAEAKAKFQLPNLEFRVLDLLTGELPSKTDAFFGNGILHHLVPHLPEFLTRMRSQVREGGSIAFIEPNLAPPICRLLFGTKPGRRLGALEPQEMAFLRDDIETLLAATGWTDIEVTTGDFLLPGLPRIFIPPSLWLEGWLQQTRLSSTLGQSHFIRARAGK
jgi:SAM-dependent methyltransferase